MKKMLIIEDPESCETCPLRSYSNLMLVCTPMREAASDVDCPLKSLPEEKWENVQDHDEHIYVNGFNDCLHIITGEGWTCKMG